MASRDYDSYIFRRGVSPNTLSVISSKNRIYAVNAEGFKKQIGVIATFDPSEARTIEPIRGIGFGDHVAELVPGVTDPMTISVTRSALYVSNIYQVFGYKSGIDGLVRSLRHHRWPFDIRQEVVFSRLAMDNITYKDNIGDVDLDSDEAPPEGASSGQSQALVTVYEACWISDYSVSYASDTALVQETVTINVSDILSQEPFSSYTEGETYDNLSSGLGLSSKLNNGGTVQ
jgi:hypothetical protein